VRHAGQLSSSLGSHGPRLLALPRALGSGASHAARLLFAKRDVIALYTLAVLASASVGVVIALFLAGG
jgi:hypothetical protein